MLLCSWLGFFLFVFVLFFFFLDNPAAKHEHVLNSGLPTWQELISELNAVVFLSVNGERRLCVQTHTLQSPPGG